MKVNILNTAIAILSCASHSKAFIPTVSQRIEYPTPNLRNTKISQEKMSNFLVMGKDLKWDSKEKMWVPVVKEFQPMTSNLLESVKDFHLMAIAS
ncbi:MAG: hypothetical protein V4629_01525 [Pseudomonadota bacterium]